MKDTKSNTPAQDSTTVESILDTIHGIKQSFDSMADAIDDLDNQIADLKDKTDKLGRDAMRFAKGYEHDVRSAVVSDEMLENLRLIVESLNGRPMRAVVVSSKGLPYSFNESGTIQSPYFVARYSLALQRAAATTGFVFSPDMMTLAYDIVQKSEHEGGVHYESIPITFPTTEEV